MFYHLTLSLPFSAKVLLAGSKTFWLVLYDSLPYIVFLLQLVL